jgi:hypothetical protein
VKSAPCWKIESNQLSRIAVKKSRRSFRTPTLTSGRWQLIRFKPEGLAGSTGPGGNIGKSKGLKGPSGLSAQCQRSPGPHGPGRGCENRKQGLTPLTLIDSKAAPENHSGGSTQTAAELFEKGLKCWLKHLAPTLVPQPRPLPPHHHSVSNATAKPVCVTRCSWYCETSKLALPFHEPKQQQLWPEDAQP